MKHAAALLALLLPAAASAQEHMARCWIAYSGFEEKVPHLDLDRCPGDSPTAQEGFCRIALQGGTVLVYVFRHNEQVGEPCLARVEQMPFNDFVASHGRAYALPNAPR